jgi:hypothetical protein
MAKLGTGGEKDQLIRMLETELFYNDFLCLMNGHFTTLYNQESKFIIICLTSHGFKT